MIAMVVGLLMISGVLTLFSSMHKANSFQSGLARLQENGRIAMTTIAADLRLAGHLPCGSHYSATVFGNNLAAHVPGAASNAFDQNLFVAGHDCAERTCKPSINTAEGVPASGLAANQHLPGTDVLTVRYLRDAGWPVNSGGSRQSCGYADQLVSIAIGQPVDDDLKNFTSQHLALLANCSAAQVFPVDATGKLFTPRLPSAASGEVPTCMTGTETRLYDLDAQLATVIYFLQVSADDSVPGRKIGTLMRRVNGVSNEVVQGVERLDLRYSLTDSAGISHWLDAGEVDQAHSKDGASLLCTHPGEASTHACSWGDINAAEVSMLVDTVDDLPADGSAQTWKYRYSFDDGEEHSPAAKMPMTGLPAGRMLRREFRSVIALRSLAS
jgi:type IV pilus assembly protein PilW